MGLVQPFPVSMGTFFQGQGMKIHAPDTGLVQAVQRLDLEKADDGLGFFIRFGSLGTGP